MKNSWIIARRELSSYFDSLIAYLLIIVFLGLSGFFTWLFGSNIFLIGQATLDVFFSVAYWTLFFFIPAVTMRTLSEETRSGTIELLSTKAVTDLQIVIGKFLGSYLLILIAIFSTFPYYISLMKLGSIDHGAVWGGYFGLSLVCAAYTAIGIFASSTTSNQIIAFLLALFIGIFFHLLFDIISTNFTGTLGSVFQFLGTRTHFESLSRGVMDSRDIIYFLSILGLGLLGSALMLSKRNWNF